MTKLIARLRGILKGSGTKPRLSIAVTLGIPGIFKIEVTFARNIGRKPPAEV